MKYDITFSCGHTGTVELFGKDKDRQKKLEYFQKNGLCSECYKKKMREEEQAQPITCNIIIFPHTATPFTLYLTGNVFSVKDTIRQLGYKWSFPDPDGYHCERSLATYKYWTKDVSMMGLEEELNELRSIFPETVVIRQYENYEVEAFLRAAEKDKREAATKAKLDETISNIAKPQKPACYPEGYWNGKFYKSIKAGHRRIYVDNKEVILSEEDCVLLDKPYSKVYLFALVERIPNYHILFPFLFWYNFAI